MFLFNRNDRKAMKKHLIYTSLICMLVGSCSLDRTSFNHITQEDLNKTEGSLSSITIGNYARLKLWVDNWHRITEYPGNNVSLSGTTTNPFFHFYNYQRVVTNQRTNVFWEESYRVIVGTNAVMEQIEEGSTNENDQLLAENLFLRGMMYFYLTNVFGRPYYQGKNNLAVPLKLTSDIADNNPRATVGQVYDQAEADLKKAEVLFTQSKENIFASREAA